MARDWFNRKATKSDPIDYRLSEYREFCDWLYRNPVNVLRYNDWEYRSYENRKSHRCIICGRLGHDAVPVKREMVCGLKRQYRHRSIRRSVTREITTRIDKINQARRNSYDRQRQRVRNIKLRFRALRKRGYPESLAEQISRSNPLWGVIREHYPSVC